VTFLFTDIEGSTRLWESAPDAMGSAIERHDSLVRSAVAAHGGYVFATGGDGFAVAFARAGEALAAALDAQAALAVEAWPPRAPVRVRMALHTGEVAERDGDYFGTPVNQVARLMAVGHGGQILCSAITAGLLGSTTTLLDLGEHRLRDLSAPERVFQVGDGVFPPLRSVDMVPTNLPTLATELVGREVEMTEVLSLLAAHRVVTVTGVGGIGKTSLSLAAAAALAPKFADGCWFVELASHRNGDQVPRAVATAMGAAATDLGELARYLAGRQALIVLDNCEHLLDDATALVRPVLAAAPEVRILATSREPLGVVGEAVHRVRSLTLPEPEADVATAERASAVQLFVERAAEASGGFVLDAAAVGPVVEICRRLDGIPLAIELAAARTRAMATREVAARLRERFRLLGGGARGAHERHRTLLAAVSWSHDLLDEHERVVFRRLAVFPASFDLEGAEAIVGADDGTDVVDCVVRLVDRSLVQYEPASGRYRLLETLRQFGLDRLAEAGETAAAQERHTGFVLNLARQLSGGPDAGRTPEAIARFHAELDNIRAAADWLDEAGRWEELITLCRRLYQNLSLNETTNGYRWYRRAAEHDASLQGQDRVDALGQLSYLANDAGDLDGARVFAEQSTSLADSLGLEQSPWAWAGRSAAFMFTDDAALACESGETAVAVAETRGDQEALITALCFLVAARAGVGDDDARGPIGDRLLRAAASSDDPWVLPSALVSLASSYCQTRLEPDFEAACRVFEDHPFAEEGIEPFIEYWVHHHWGFAEVALGRPTGVSRLVKALRIADRLGADAGLMHGIGTITAGLALGCVNAGDLVAAAQLTGYAASHVAALDQFHNPGRTYAEQKVERALHALPTGERSRNERIGAALTRREFMSLVGLVQLKIAEAPETHAGSHVTLGP
jgi:predicted ATPase